jgi:tyrosine-protein kinase Etk/Wzc
MDVGDGTTTIAAAAPERRRLLFTGVDAGDGVTTLAAAAALGFARNLRRRTLLIETNVHSPGLAAYLGVELAGFAEYCRGEIGVTEAIRPTDTPLLHAIAAGSAPESSGLFAESRVAELFDGLSGIYDRIVVDAAPVLDHPDTLLVVRVCDATILIARAHHSPSTRVRAAAARLRATGVPVIGTVLNQVRHRAPAWLERAGGGGGAGAPAP